MKTLLLATNINDEGNDDENITERSPSGAITGFDGYQFIVPLTGFEEYPEILPSEPVMLICYKSELYSHFRYMTLMDSMVELAYKKNCRLKIGGYLEVQTPMKYVEQTIYGREDVLTKLYVQIYNDSRHIIIEHYSQTFDKYDDGSSSSIFAQLQVDGGWGMAYKKREKGVHYVIFDHLTQFALDTIPDGHPGKLTFKKT